MKNLRILVKPGIMTNFRPSAIAPGKRREYQAPGYSMRRKNRALLQDFLSSPRIKIIEMDEETSERYTAFAQSG